MPERQPAQHCLFSRYAEQMFILCYRYVKNREDAEELMLNGFLSFFKSIARFQYNGEGSVAPWLRKIMINECLMFLRKSNDLRMTSLGHDVEQSIDDEIIARMSADDIYRLILRLPVGYRTIFNLYVVEGMGHKEIAEMLKISEGTSKSQLSKAKSLLRTMITENEDIHRQGLYPSGKDEQRYPFAGSLSISYLVRRKGDFFQKNSFRLGFGGLKYDKLLVEPVIYFHDLFRGVTPGLKLSVSF